MKKALICFLLINTIFFLPNIFARKTVAIRNAKHAIEKAIEYALLSSDENALMHLDSVSKLVKLRQEIGSFSKEESLDSIEKIKTIRREIEDRNVNAPLENTLSEETKLIIASIGEKVKERRYSEASEIHLNSIDSLKTIVVEDLVNDLKLIDLESLLPLEIEKFVASFRTYASTPSVGWQILHASQAELAPDGYLDYENFNFDYLNPSELLQLLKMVEALSTAKKAILAPFVFDIKDRIIRLSYENDALCAFFLNTIDKKTEVSQHLWSTLNALKTQSMDFYPLIDESGSSFKKIKTAKIDQAKRASSSREGTTIIFQAAYEAPNMRLGGLGTFLKDFSNALSNYTNTDIRFISQFCDFLKKKYPNPTFHGFVDHECYNQVMRSSIYSIKIDENITQYLIKADPKMARVFDLGREMNVYKSFRHSEYNPKMVYFNSAAATLAATYQLSTEKIKSNNIILHLHSWHTALAAVLIKTHLNSIRQEAGLTPVKILNTIHMHGSEQGVIDATIFTKVGLPLPERRYPIRYILNNSPYSHPTGPRSGIFYRSIDAYAGNFMDAYGNYLLPKDLFTSKGYGEFSTYEGRHLDKHINQVEETEMINLLIEGAFASDFSNTVSPGLAEEMKDPNLSWGVYRVFSELNNKNRFRGILSGINTENFNPCSTSVLGKFAVDESLSDLAEKKKDAKAALYEAGLIADPLKPLFLYMGRFSDEKGIEYLPAMAKQISDKGGQLLVAGITPYEIPQAIKDLIILSDEMPVSIWQKLADQRKLLKDHGVQQGMLARFAADYTLIPSKIESCGLIGIEALCMGSFLATSYVQGLKNICIPFEDTSTINVDANCVKYDYSFDSKEKTNISIQQMLQKCFDLEATLSEVEKTNIKKHIITTARQHNWSGAPLEGYLEIYRELGLQ